MNVQKKAVFKKFGGKTEYYCDIEGCEKIAPHMTSLNSVNPNDFHHFCANHFKEYFTDAYCISQCCQDFKDIESKFNYGYDNGYERWCSNCKRRINEYEAILDDYNMKISEIKDEREKIRDILREQYKRCI